MSAPVGTSATTRAYDEDQRVVADLGVTGAAAHDLHRCCQDALLQCAWAPLCNLLDVMSMNVAHIVVDTSQRWQRRRDVPGVGQEIARVLRRIDGHLA